MTDDFSPNGTEGYRTIETTMVGVGADYNGGYNPFWALFSCGKSCFSWHTQCNSLTV